MLLSTTLVLALCGMLVSAKSGSASHQEEDLVEYQIWLPKVPFERAAEVCQANGLKLARFDPKQSPYLLTAMRGADVKDLWTASPSPINKAALVRHPDPNSRTFWTGLFSKHSQELLYKRAAVLCKVPPREEKNLLSDPYARSSSNELHRLSSSAKAAKTLASASHRLSEQKKGSTKKQRKATNGRRLRQEARPTHNRVRINGKPLKGKALSRFLNNQA